MGFKHLVGKEVLWTGEITNKETGCTDTYILFSDYTGMMIPDKDNEEPATMLDDAKDTLSTLVAENFDQATAILALGEILQHRAFKSWMSKIVEEKNDKEKISKIQALKLPAEEEFKAMVESDIPKPEVGDGKAP